MSTKAQPFLMFEGQAEEAMNFYVATFPGGKVLEVVRWRASELEPFGDAGKAKVGTIRKASFSVAGLTVLCTDSPVKHEFTFTASMSFFVDCASEEELGRLYAALEPGGKVFMPIGDYGWFAQVRLDRRPLRHQLAAESALNSLDRNGFALLLALETRRDRSLRESR